jgi:hypothetical protein
MNKRNDRYLWFPPTLGVLAVIFAVYFACAAMISSSIFSSIFDWLAITVPLVVFAVCSFLLASLEPQPPKNPDEATFPRVYWADGSVRCYVGSLAALVIPAPFAALFLSGSAFYFWIVVILSRVLFMALAIASVAIQRKHFRY